jgi:aminocarboxymuconate-semialdehyde decarboxylase
MTKGLPGAMVFSNVNGVALADTVFGRCGRRPTTWTQSSTFIRRIGRRQAMEHWLMPLVGFLMDTTLAAAHLVFAGVPERYPRIRWVLCHMGGAIPYLAERLDRGYEAFSECRRNISRAPSTYLKQFYYDTVNFDVNCIELAIRFAGADHILAGSDYPHQIGSIPKMLDAVSRLPVSPAEREGIAGRNAAALLGVNS